MAERGTRKRDSYHHGNLRAAMIEAGTELARAGGPNAVVLRAVAREVGVAPNSAYAHFPDLASLREAVSQRALGEMGAAMLNDLQGVAVRGGPDGSRGQATAYLADVGRAYVRFALAEPGLFRTAMGGNPAGTGIPGDAPKPNPDQDERTKPDVILLGALDKLVIVGCLRTEDVPDGVTTCWAVVHGLATMFLDLQPAMPSAQRQRITDAALKVLILGLLDNRDPDPT